MYKNIPVKIVQFDKRQVYHKSRYDYRPKRYRKFCDFLLRILKRLGAVEESSFMQTYEINEKHVRSIILGINYQIDMAMREYRCKREDLKIMIGAKQLQEVMYDQKIDVMELQPMQAQSTMYGVVIEVVPWLDGALVVQK
jgi:hypothetical protein